MLRVVRFTGDWTFVDDGAARAVDEVNAIAAAQGSEEQGKYLLREVLTLLRRAQRGKCTVVETVDGERIGDVDRMDYGRSLVLELRCHVPLEGDPRGC